MSSEHGKSTGLAAAALAAGAACLAFAFTRPPQGLCDPVLGMPLLVIVLAQALGFLAFRLLRLAGHGGAVLGAAGVTWALVSAGALFVRTCAGHLDSAVPADAAVAAGAGAALAMLAGGLSSGAKGGARVAASCLVLALAGYGAARLMDARAHDRTWQTWSRMQVAGLALMAAADADGRFPPGDNVELSALAGALPPDAREGLVTDDAWGHPLRYTLKSGSWRLASQGADDAPGPYSDGPSRDFADDLVLVQGSPVAWPEQPCSAGPRPPPKDPNLHDQRGRRRK